MGLGYFKKIFNEISKNDIKFVKMRYFILKDFLTCIFHKYYF